MATIHQGEEVQIIGQYNEYFKIKPPKDSYVYVNKQFVDPIETPAPPPAQDPPIAHNEKMKESDGPSVAQDTGPAPTTRLPRR